MQHPPNAPDIACSTFSFLVNRGIPSWKKRSLSHPTLQLNNYSHLACARVFCRAPRHRQSVVLSSKLFQLHSARNARASPLKDLHSNSNHGKSILQRVGTVAKASICMSLRANQSSCHSLTKADTRLRHHSHNMSRQHQTRTHALAAPQVLSCRGEGAERASATPRDEPEAPRTWCPACRRGSVWHKST